MLSTNRSGQLPLDDDVKETVNVEPNDKNLKKNLKRTRAKESQVSEADWNLNNCNRLNNCNWPTTITNSPNYLIKPKDQLLLWKEDQKIKISLKESCTWKTKLQWIEEKKKSNDLVIFANSITNFSRYQKIFPIKDLLNRQGDINQVNYILQNIEHIVYKCRQFDLKNILSRLTITNRLPEELIKDLNFSICNIYRRPILIL